MNRNGSKVAHIEASNRRIKKDDTYVKQARFTFENGQKATLYIADEGDIYQLTINGKKTPLPSAKTLDQLAKGLHSMLERNQSLFDKSQLKKINRPANLSTTKPISRSLKKRAEEARAVISTLNASKETLNTELQIAQANKTEQSIKKAQLLSQLEQEKSDTKKLKQQLRELQESMA